MFYKPNHCCHCGDKIDRIEWHVWTNRRFCELCETEFVFDDWSRRIVPLVFLITGLFGLGAYFRRPEPPLVIETAPAVRTVPEHSQTRPAAAEKEARADTAAPADAGQGSASNDGPGPAVPPPASARPAPTPPVRQKEPGPPVYFCGAETRKGNPCSRKVRGGGRCWQHVGREAMLPETELLAEEN